MLAVICAYERGSFSMKNIKKIFAVLIAMMIVVSALSLSAVSASAAAANTTPITDNILYTISLCEPDNAGGNGTYDPFGVAATSADDAENGHGSEAAKLETENFVEGTSAVRIDVAKAVDANRLKTRFVIRNIDTQEPYTVSDVSTTYLEFWIYISGLRNIDGAASAVELSEQQDKKEYQYTFTQLNSYMKSTTGADLKDNAWNHCKIPLVKMSSLSLTINKFRLFLFSNGSGDSYVIIDDIVLTKGSAVTETASSSSSSSTSSSSTGSYTGEINIAGNKTSSTSSASSSSKASSTGSVVSAASSLKEKENSSSEETSSLSDDDIATVVNGIADGSITNISEYTEEEQTAIKNAVIAAGYDVTFNDDGTLTLNKEESNGWLIWVIIAAAVVILAGGGLAVYFLVLKKPAAPAAEAPAVEEAPAAEGPADEVSEEKEDK